MNIKKTFRDVFIAIARKFGLELKDKVYSDETEYQYSDIGLNPIAIGANVISTIAVDDSTIEIKGDNARAKALSDIVQYYQDDIRSAAVEVAAGTGDCIIRPYSDGERIGINIIENSDFSIIDSVGNFIKSAIIRLDGYTDENNKQYDLFELQTLKESEGITYVSVMRIAYKDMKEQISLAETQWSDMDEEQIIPAEQLLFGRIKCPTVNRTDPNSVNGVPITFGCEKIIREIKQKYVQYNKEFDKKEAKLFADKTLFAGGNNNNNKSSFSFPDNDVYQFVNGDTANGGVKNLIDDYSPDIRDESLKNGENFNLSILELCCGFSRGIFTSPETSFATATEMRNSLKKTFSFIKKFRTRIESGERQLFKAIDIIMNLNSTTPIGDYEICNDWSYDYIEETKERFNQLIQSHNIGAIPTWKVAAWTENLDEETAKALVIEAAAENEPEQSPKSNEGDGIED